MADIAATKLATAKYVNNLALAKKDGYQIITRMIPTMGYHFMNPDVKGFDVSKPPILVYEHRGIELAARARWSGCSRRSRRSHRSPVRRTAPSGPAATIADGTFVPADGAGVMPDEGPGIGREVHLLAPAARDAAHVALVPEPERAVLGHQPARHAVQPGLSGRGREARGARRGPRVTETK